jgi:hypothetical protein
LAPASKVSATTFDVVGMRETTVPTRWAGSPGIAGGREVPVGRGVVRVGAGVVGRGVPFGRVVTLARVDGLGALVRWVGVGVGRPAVLVAGREVAEPDVVGLPAVEAPVPGDPPQAAVTARTDTVSASAATCRGLRTANHLSPVVRGSTVRLDARARERRMSPRAGSLDT